MGFCGDVGQSEFRERLGNTDDGFELADCDGDGGADVGAEFGGVHLATDGHKVGRELLGRFRGEARCAASG